VIDEETGEAPPREFFTEPWCRLRGRGDESLAFRKLRVSIERSLLRKAAERSWRRHAIMRDRRQGFFHETHARRVLAN
jgi:hypothetical protein